MEYNMVQHWEKWRWYYGSRLSVSESDAPGGIEGSASICSKYYQEIMTLKVYFSDDLKEIASYRD